MTAERKSDYEIGYGRPPVHARFKKGHSGNPRGRPRGAKSLIDQLIEALDERAEVEGADGRRRKIARRKLGMIRLAEKFAAGEAPATRIVLDLVREIERGRPPEPALRPPFAASDRAVISNFIARLRRS